MLHKRLRMLLIETATLESATICVNQESFAATTHTPTRCNTHSNHPAAGPRSRKLACHALIFLQQVHKGASCIALVALGR